MTYPQPPDGRPPGDQRAAEPLPADPTPPIGMTRPPTDPSTPGATAPPPAPTAPTGDEPSTGRGADTGKATAGRSRLGGLWVGLIVAAVILVLLLIFVLQNSQTVQVDYFGFSGQLPLAVAILLGVAAGALLVALPGSVRIIQLRRSVHRK